MLPAGGLSASLSNTENTAQTTGPLGSATAPIFQKTVQIGRDNSSNPSATATPTASASASPAGAAGSLPAWLLPVALGGAVALVLGLVLTRKKG